MAMPNGVWSGWVRWGRWVVSAPYIKIVSDSFSRGGRKVAPDPPNPPRARTLIDTYVTPRAPRTYPADRGVSSQARVDEVASQFLLAFESMCSLRVAPANCIVAIFSALYIKMLLVCHWRVSLSFNGKMSSLSRQNW